MSDKFLSAEKPKSDTDSGWIEYALLLGWEELPVGYEYVTDNATTELATLRAQLAEAREALEPFAKYGSKCTEYEESTWEFRIKGRHFAKALKIYNELVTTA